MNEYTLTFNKDDKTFKKKWTINKLIQIIGYSILFMLFTTYILEFKKPLFWGILVCLIQTIIFYTEKKSYITTIKFNSNIITITYYLCETKGEISGEIQDFTFKKYNSFPFISSSYLKIINYDEITLK